MKNIEIIVDVTGSCAIKEIEEQLSKIKEELKNKELDASVTFVGCFGADVVNKKLSNVEIPFTNEDLKSFHGGFYDFTGLIKERLRSNFETIIIIGDLVVPPLEENTFYENLDANLLVIQTSSPPAELDTSYSKDFVKNVKLREISLSDVKSYLSLDAMLNPMISAKNKIEQMRNSISTTNNSDSKLKP